MPMDYKDSFDLINCYEEWAKNQTQESQLEMLKIYRTILEKGKHKMKEPERAVEYVNIRIQELKNQINP